MNIIFGDVDTREKLLPLTFTRPTSALRCGILTLGEKWQQVLPGTYYHATAAYLQDAFPLNSSAQNLLINPLVFPTAELLKEVNALGPDETLKSGSTWIAAQLSKEQLSDYLTEGKLPERSIESTSAVSVIEYPWNLFQQNGGQIRADYQLLTKSRASAEAHSSATLIGDDIFIEEGASVINCSLNALDGPIYIGKNAKVQDGAFIKGPFALCEGATVNMAAKIKDATTVGPHSKVGGEIGNSILIGYSNKGHDGYLGNSVIGEWCNLGADTNTSNLKNNYSNVRAWSYTEGQAVDTETQFCGLIMGDHSKSGINTMFNTGTVVGVCANIFGGDFPPKHIPSFSWGGSTGFTAYRFDKAMEVAEKVMARRKVHLDDVQIRILEYINQNTEYNS